ncbi:MAG: condensation domain-containing protein, partial [Rhodanobacter sp.]
SAEPSPLTERMANYLADFKGVAGLPGQQAGGQYTPAANCIDALVPWSELKGLDSLCIDLGVTRFTVLLSAHLAVLHRLTGAPDIVVGVDVAGRDHGDTQRMVGYFVNVVPVRSTLANSAEVLTFRDFSERTAKSLRTVLDHAELPTDQIVQCAREAGIRPAGGLINSLFVMQNFPTGNFRIEGLDINSVDVAASYSKFGMEFFLTESSNGLKYRCHYSKALFGTESMPAVLRQWRQLIKRLVNSPETKFMNVFPDIAAVGGRRVDASVW